MLKAALSAGVVAVLAVMLLVSRAPQSAEAATLFVFNPSDSGFGTLRWAVDQANGNSSIDRIVVKTTVPITLYEPVVYTGSQTLMVQGDHALLYRIIQGTSGIPAATDHGGCALFISSGGADITFYQLVFRNSWCNGIEVLSHGGDGEIAVTLNKVIVEDNNGKGVYISEALGGGSISAPVTPTSFKLSVISSFIRNNGECDFTCQQSHGGGDGLVVNEESDGGITATCTGSSFSGNHGDGLELSEDGAGSVTFTGTNCQFNNNGDPDFEPESAATTEDGEGEAGTAVDNESFDGLHIRERDNGDVTVTLNSPVVANGNMDDGVDARERDDGKMTFTATGVTADGNENEGVDVYEEGAGNATVKLTNVKTWHNGVADSGDHGVEITEDGEDGSGDLSVDVTNSSSNFNSGDGYDIDEFEAGKLTAKFQTVVANGNGDDGFEVGESGTGAFTTTIYGSTAQGNGDDAVDADADDETGTIAFGTSTLIGNIELTNVNVIP